MASLKIAGIENVTPEFLSLIQLPDAHGKKLHYLFVMPSMAPDADTPYGFPTGFAIVCAALKASGRSVFTLNLNYKDDPVAWLRHAILTKNIDVVLTGGMVSDLRAISAILDAAKEVKPAVVTVVGGALISGDPVSAMTALKNADYGVIGEGEITVNALAHALEHDRDPSGGGLRGILCKRDGEWSAFTAGESIHDINILPFPDYLGFEYEQMLTKSGQFPYRYTELVGSNRIASLSVTRSCPYRCTFCFRSGGNAYRRMSLDRVFQQIDWLLSLYPLDGLFLLSDLTFSDTQVALEFCRRIKPYNLRWIITSRADVVTEEMLVLMKGSGCVYQCIGVESADNRILKSMGKSVTIEQVDKAFELSHRIGLFTMGNLIFGDPEETTESVRNSLEWWWKRRHFTLRLTRIAAFPGSQIYKTACEKGLIKDPVRFLQDGCPPVNLSRLTDDEYSVLPAVFSMIQTENAILDAVIEPLGDATVNVSGRCPHCLKRINFPRFESLFNTTPQTCPVCRKSVGMNPFEYCDHATLSEAANALLGGKSAAVWAITQYNFYWLLRSMPALQAGNVYFVNTYEIVLPETGKAVKTLGGKTVFAPEVIEKENIETVLVPNNRQIFHTIRAQCKKRFPQVKKIVHITELIRQP